MPQFRMTIRLGGQRPGYEIMDLDAADLRAALEQAVDHFPAGAGELADLVEIRRQVDPDARLHTPE